MEQIGQTVACACAVGISLTVAEYLIPSAKFQKQLRLIFSLLLMLGLILPFARNLTALPDSVAAAEQTAAPAADEFESLLSEETSLQLCRSLADSLAENGVSVSGITADVHISGDGRITISEVRLSCSDPQTAERVLVQLLGEGVALEITEGSE
ncbi:MAG: hypothetical protein E7501_02090 [Ruminococcus sp.]|nr:hypothetical protein [Ruminococcus sp.]